MSARETAVRAAVAHSPDAPFTTSELWLREPAPRELLVRVVASGICHTDVMTKVEGLCSFPIVLGHEGAGVVEAVGADVTGFQVGDHVVLSYDYCGTCRQCRREAFSYCDSHGRLNFGGTRPDGGMTHRRPESDSADVFGSFFQQSSFATLALTHASNTIKVDASLPLRLLAPLGCGVQTGAGTVLNTLAVEPDATLAVFGCGAVGLSAIMAATVAEARNIIAIDVNAKRLDMAEELGANHRFQPADFDEPPALVDAVRAASGTNGCQYAIDTTGVPSVLRQAFDCCGRLGAAAMIAPGVAGTEVTIETLGLLPGKSLRGVIQGDSRAKEFIPRLIELWSQGRFPFDRLITTFDGIDSVETAVQAMRAGDVIKPVVTFQES